MLYFNKIDVSGGIDVNKTSESKDSDICHYWYFLNKGLKFQPNVFNICHALSMMSINLRDTATENIKSGNYCTIISRITVIILI